MLPDGSAVGRKQPVACMSGSDLGIDLTSPLSLQPIYAGNLELAAFRLVVDRRRNVHLQDLQAIGNAVIRDFASADNAGPSLSLPYLLEVDQDMLASADLGQLCRNHFILEFPARLATEDQVLPALQHLASKGYRLATSGTSAELVHAVPTLPKIDLACVNAATLEQSFEDDVSRLKTLGLDLVADNLGSPEDFDRCLYANFDYFHGEFLARARKAQPRGTSSSRLLLLQILAELERPDASIDDLEALILKEANLTYKFMAVVNSATFGAEREIGTLFQALAMLGTEQIRAWVGFFLLENRQDQPPDLIRQSLVRARMCEVIAKMAEKDVATSYFIVGLLSQLDILAQTPMVDLLSETPLSASIKDALLSRKGEQGEVLQETINYEQGDFDNLSLLPGSFYVSAYQHSFAWARQLLGSLNV